MSDVIELQERMEHMENTLNEIRQQVGDIRRGLFGDDQFGHAGIAERIKNLEKEVDEIKKVNRDQEISINTKSDFTDNIVLWFQRAFWAGAVVLVLMLLLTGKIGMLDLIRGLMD